MKQPGERVTLRVAFGEIPSCGSVLCMASGRRYWVWKTAGKTLHCRVMAPGDPVPAHAVAVIQWRWAGRVRSARRAGKPIAQLIAEACSKREAGDARAAS